MSIRSETLGCDVTVDNILQSRLLYSFCLGLWTEELQISFRLVNPTFISRQHYKEHLVAVFVTSPTHAFGNLFVEFWTLNSVL